MRLVWAKQLAKVDRAVGCVGDEMSEDDDALPLLSVEQESLTMVVELSTTLVSCEQLIELVDEVDSGVETAELAENELLWPMLEQTLPITVEVPLTVPVTAVQITDSAEEPVVDCE